MSMMLAHDATKHAGPSTVADIMRRDVVTISPSASIRELVDLLRDRGISGVPVVDDAGEAVGTVSVTDVMWRGRWFVPDAGRAARALEESTVRDVMTPDVFGVKPDSTLAELIEFFASTGLKRAIVREGRMLVGIVSSTDVLSLIADQPASGKPGVASGPRSSRPSSG